MKYLSILLLIVFIQSGFGQTGKITGVILNSETGEALVGANIFTKQNSYGAVSNQNGEFTIFKIQPGNYELIITYIGYEKQTLQVDVQDNQTAEITIHLKPTSILGKEIVVLSTRAKEGETPAAFSTLKREEIKRHYYAQDIPVILSSLPSTTFYSENGNGIGYNYLSIRGFGQRRISVMINGVPQNDPEDHNVYWLDFPDLLGNVEDIQVQRGAGSAFYGPPAIGGSVNIITSQFSPLRKISAFAGYGTYNTRKYSVSMNSGLLGNRYVLFGRLSQITSDGYRDQSWTDFKSYFIGAARFGKRSSTRIHFYGGPIEDHLAYYGISKKKAQDRELRRENPITNPDEIENFNQPHLELIHEIQLSENLKLNNTFFGIRGYGFFDYDGSWAPFSYFRLTPDYGFDVTGDPDTSFASNILIRAYVDNKQAGWFPQLHWTHHGGEVVLGSEIRLHRSLHWGRIQKGSSDLPRALSGSFRGLNYIGERRYYEYKGAKDIISPYLHTTYRLKEDIMLMFDLQFAYNRYRLYDEKFIDTDFTLKYYFLNPRFGINYNLNRNLSAFVSFSQTSREPRLKNFYDAAEASTPTIWGAVIPQFEINTSGSYNFDKPLVEPETLNDYEVGLRYQHAQWRGSINLFYMDFRDEIIKKGQLDRFGQPITGNADRTLHTGFEGDFSARLLPDWVVSGNLTLSNNKLKKYFEYDGNGDRIDLSGNTIAGFPDFMANISITYARESLTGSVNVQHVGKQYTDNYQEESHTVDPYSVFHGMVGYSFSNITGISHLVLQMHFRNLFDTLYITHGEGGEFFPAAERQIFLNARIEI